MRNGVCRRGGRSDSVFVAAREDLEVFGELYDVYADKVVRYLVRQTLDPEVAFDLMAETFAEALDGIALFRGSDDEAGRSWLFSIATHQLIRWRKRGALERRKIQELGVSVRDLGREEFERIEHLADLQRFKPVLDLALRRLSVEQREVLRLRVIEGRSYDEIADKFGVTNDAIRLRVSRSLRQLAVTLGRLGALEACPNRHEREICLGSTVGSDGAQRGIAGRGARHRGYRASVGLSGRAGQRA